MEYLILNIYATDVDVVKKLRKNINDKTRIGIARTTTLIDKGNIENIC